MALIKLRMTFTAVIESDLPIDEAIAQLSQESSYEFPSVEGVEVLSTEWVDTQMVEEWPED